MKRLHFTWQATAICLVGFSLTISCLADRSEQPHGNKESSEQQIDKLIAQLGSSNFGDRELAQKKLILLNEAVPALQKATKSPDSEVASRAEYILKAIGERQAEEWLSRLNKLAQQGQVDQLIEQVVYNWHSSRKEAAWQIVGRLGSELIKWEQREFKRADLDSLLSDGKKFPGMVPPLGRFSFGLIKEITGKELILRKAPRAYSLFRAEKIVIKTSSPTSIFVSAGCIDNKGGSPTLGIYLANDFVAGIPWGVIVCDGEFKGDIRNALVIARGGVTYGHIGSSVVLSGGPVRPLHNHPKIVHSAIISASVVERPKADRLINSVIKENQPNPFGWIKFFEPSQVGIEVESANNAVRIKKLDPANVFAKAGLHAGDVLLSLDKSPVKSVEGFRKQLRHSLAVQPQSTFEVRRAEKTVTILVKNPG